ncbi:MAG: 30S ribosomal protein S4 [Nanoarchaeota archaeon]|nr:30S ribosomal protein S4 [Nanoarchaeota archaeon]
MGDPRKLRKQYTAPAHPWERARIEKEKVIMDTYAPKNKLEIWKMDSVIKNCKDQAKKLSALRTKQADKEQKELLSRLFHLGLIEESATLENILTLKLEDVMERRLQTMAVKRGLARSMSQARQFITHGHVRVGDKVMTSPSYLLKRGEEETLSFRIASRLSDPEHPERKAEKKPKAPKGQHRMEKPAEEQKAPEAPVVAPAAEEPKVEA